jgi:hypothetical protein
MYRQIHTHTCALGTGFKLILFKVQYEMLETQHLMHKGSRLIIVVVQVGAVKIYVAPVKALRKTERRG